MIYEETVKDDIGYATKEGAGNYMDHMNPTILRDDFDSPENFNLDVFLEVYDGPDSSSCSFTSSPPPLPDASLLIGQIEDYLFHDQPDPPQLIATDDFLSGILLDSPVPSSDNNLFPSPDSMSLQQCYCPPLPQAARSQQEAAEDFSQPQESQQQSPLLSRDSNPELEEDHHRRCQEEEDGDDPITKKRKRQMRNRDAAIRSRERKKVYVSDLEMKSRHYESECRRLGMLLQCCIAENHALRLYLHNNSQAFGASTTKQESAVLLLESLLLGSLLWLLGVIGLHILPRQLLSILEATSLENLGSLAPREAGSNVIGTLELHHRSFMMSKRCRGSRRLVVSENVGCLMHADRELIAIPPRQNIKYMLGRA